MTDTLLNHAGVFTIVAALPLFGITAKAFGQSFERIAKWYLYIAVFAVVIVMDSIFFPFIGGKDWFFRFSIELSLISVLLWWAFEARDGEIKSRLKQLFKKPLVRAVTVFVVAFLLACLFANDVHAAFWSNYERGEGGFQMIHYYLFFLLLAFLFREEKDWRRIFGFSLCAAGLMIIYGLFGNFGTAGFIGPYAGTTIPSDWIHKLIDGRFDGSLGNPAYVAPYLMFSMFFAGYLWIMARRDKRATKMTAWSYGALIVIFLFFFFLSQTRGAFIGMILAAFVFLLYLFFAGTSLERKWSGILLAVFIVIGGGLFAVRNTTFVKNLPEGRLLQLSLSDPTAQTRLWVWGEAWQGFLERPVFGWGPENFTAVYDAHFNPKFFVPGQNTETWFDRAHSVYFDYLSETGIIGLLSYLGIFGVFAWEFFKTHRRKAAGIVLAGIILAIPVAYLGQGVAIFDVFPMYLCLFLFMAFATFYFEKGHVEVAKSEAHK
jgi:O-antigen ligase